MFRYILTRVYIFGICLLILVYLGICLFVSVYFGIFWLSLNSPFRYVMQSCGVLTNVQVGVRDISPQGALGLGGGEVLKSGKELKRESAKKGEKELNVLKK